MGSAFGEKNNGGTGSGVIGPGAAASGAQVTAAGQV